MRCLHRAAVQVVDLNNLVGYKMMKAPEEFEFNEYLDLLPTDFKVTSITQKVTLTTVTIIYSSQNNIVFYNAEIQNM